MAYANVTESLKAGILSGIKDTWRQEAPVFKKQQDVLLRFLEDSTIRDARWGWKETTPFPEYRGYNEGRNYKTFRDRSITLGLYIYDLAISWSKFDEEDDQLGDLVPHVQAAVKRFLMLPDVLLSEYFNGTASLNPALLNSYDGSGAFSATDGDGNNRLGVSGGNIVTGSGVTASGVMHDIAQVQKRLLDMRDPTAGKPIYSPEEVSFDKLFVIAPTSMNELLQKISKQEMIRSDLGSVTAESNFMKATFEYSLNPYLTDASDFYVVVRHPYWKPFIYRAPKGPETVIADMNNSDRAREYNERYMISQIRTSLGVWFPGSIVKVNN